MRSNQGFTLVEAIVAGLLSVIVGGIMITVININGTQMSQSILSGRVGMQYEIVVSQIAQKTRYSSFILCESDLVAFPTTALAAVTGKLVIKMYDTTTGAPRQIGGFQRPSAASTTLEEYTQVGGTWAWRPFKIGNDTAKVTATSSFSLSKDRKTVTLKLSVFDADMKNLKDTIPTGQEVFVCRN